MNLTIPSKVRLITYIVLGVLGVAQGALYAGYTAAHFADPHITVPIWLLAASAAYGSVVGAPFTIAALNIKKDDPNLKSDIPIDSAPVEQVDDELLDEDIPTEDGANTGPADEVQPA